MTDLTAKPWRMPKKARKKGLLGREDIEVRKGKNGHASLHPLHPNNSLVLLILTFLAGVRTMVGAGVGMMVWGKGVNVCWWVCWWVCWC